MTGIVVIAHAPLATAFGECVEHVYSCEPGVTRREVRLLDVSSSEQFEDPLRFDNREEDSLTGLVARVQLEF